MKLIFISLFLTISSFAHSKGFPPVKAEIIKETDLISKELKEQNPNIPVCMYAYKDYTSNGFAIPKREGFYISGQFGCVFYCGCKGRAFYVTHVYQNSYYDGAIWSQQTGGPKRAKWFICPHSVDNDSWKPMYDELGRLIGYNVDEDKSFFEPRVMNNLKELSSWENLKCQ